MNLYHSSTSSNLIYADLCEKIEKLDYKPGQLISENDLCELYDTSRHMVRGALTMLRDRKLIEVLPQRGTFVSLIDMTYIEDILYLRESVEQEALQRIIRSGDTAGIAGILSKNIDAQKKCGRLRGYTPEFIEIDNEFHRAFFTAAGKEEVVSLISDLYIHVRRWRNIEARSEERMQQIIKEHEEIRDAVRDRNIEAAREKLHEHLDTVGRYGKKLEELQKEYFTNVK